VGAHDDHDDDDDVPTDDECRGQREADEGHPALLLIRSIEVIP